MKRASLLLVCTALLATALSTPAPARAQVPADCLGSTPLPPRLTAPYAFVRLGAVCVNLSPRIVLDPATGLFNLNVLQPLTIGDGRLNRLRVTYKRDPYIDFGLNTANLLFPAASAYEFYFGTPIDPGLYNRATSTGTIAVTNGPTGSGAVVQSGGEEFITVFGSDGPALIPLGVDIGTGRCTAVTSPCRYPGPSGGPASTTFDPVFLDNLEVQVIYRQEGLASEVDLSGRAEVFAVAAVPEPGTALLTAAGAATLLGGAAARRRRA